MKAARNDVSVDGAIRELHVQHHHDKLSRIEGSDRDVVDDRDRRREPFVEPAAPRPAPRPEAALGGGEDALGRHAQPGRDKLPEIWLYESYFRDHRIPFTPEFYGVCVEGYLMQIVFEYIEGVRPNLRIRRSAGACSRRSPE